MLPRKKVSLNRLNDPPEMQQVVRDMAGTRFTLHLSYTNRRIGVLTEVRTSEREIADGAPARERDKSRPLYPKYLVWLSWLRCIDEVRQCAAGDGSHGGVRLCTVVAA